MPLPSSALEKFHELSFYTLAHPDKSYFIHQHIVDAYLAQTADASTKPIGLIFALAGLYLFLEKNYSGRQVQLAHMKMAENKTTWPSVALPEQRGAVTVDDVLDAAPGIERDALITAWCKSVWEAYQPCHDSISSCVSAALLINP